MARLVVVGAGVGGLSAAIHARLAGFDVVVLEKGEAVGGKAAGILQQGYALDPGPSILILTRIYRELFAAAGRQMDDYLKFRRLPVISRVVMEGEPAIDLPADYASCMSILRGLSTVDAEAMERLIERVGKVEPLLWRSVYKHEYSRPWQLLDSALARFGLPLQATTPFKDVVDSLFQSPLLRAFFYGFPSYGGQSYRSPSPGSFLIPYYMLTEGVWVAEGGVRAIPQALMKLATELGVDFEFGTEVTSVETAGRQITQVKTASGHLVKGDAFVVNQDRFTFARHLGRAVTAEPSYSYFTAHWGIRRTFADLQHHNLYVPRTFEDGFQELYSDGRFPRQPIVYVNATAGEDSEAAPVGCSNLFAVVTCPSRGPGEVSDDEGRLRIREVLSRFGLTWEERDVDFERTQSPRWFEEAHGNYRGSLYGLAERHRHWGMFPAPNRDEQFTNLAYCGGSVQPGAGLPMVTLSGRFAVQALARRLR